MLPSTDPFGIVGQVLDGQFRVDSYVGEGGFSVVYRGTSVGLSEPIAVKCLKLPPALGSALVESFVHRFRDESRLHYKLSQGNLHVVRSIASGTIIAPATSALVPYTVLEWLEGRSLADELADRRQRGLHGRPVPEVIRLLDTAVDALAYAHSQGVVHRDLNPGNLFLAKTATGTKLKVLDFGVAKVLSDSAIAMGTVARTVGNVRMFAPAYGAPEQFDESVGPIGPWTDVYAIALVFMEAARDRTVMEGEHIGEFAMKALDPRVRPTPRWLGIPVGDLVHEVLSMAVTIDPKERPRDAGHLWGMLKHALTGDEKTGRPPHARAPRLASDPPPPNTLRIHERVPEGAASPVVEVIRPANAVPATGPGRERGYRTLEESGPGRERGYRTLEESGPGRERGSRLSGTVRIPGAPRTGSEALAAMPVVAPQAAPLPSSAASPLYASAVAPFVPPAAFADPSAPPDAMAPLHASSSVPPAPVVRDAQRSTPPARASRAPVVLFVVLAVVVVVLAAAVWLFVVKGYRVGSGEGGPARGESLLAACRGMGDGR
jgi:serine/threonine-protein kinase